MPRLIVLRAIPDAADTAVPATAQRQRLVGRKQSMFPLVEKTGDPAIVCPKRFDINHINHRRKISKASARGYQYPDSISAFLHSLRFRLLRIESLGARAGADQSVRHMGSATASAVRLAGLGSPSPDPAAGSSGRKRHHCREPNRSGPYPRETPRQSVAPATSRSILRLCKANQAGRGRPATPNGHSSAVRSQRARSAAAT